MTEKILVDYVGDHRTWTEVVEYVADDVAVIQWEQPDGTVVRATAVNLGETHPETGEPVWTWDGEMTPVPAPFYRVYGHSGGRCEIESRHATAEEAMAECARRNAEEKEAHSGWYCTTDVEEEEEEEDKEEDETE